MIKAAAGKPRPSLFFSRDYHKLAAKAAEKEPEVMNLIESQVMTNVVLLASLPRNNAAARRLAAVYRGSCPKQIQTSEILSPYSQEQARSKTAHYRVSVAKGNCAGKFLVFGTQNVIRAGKHTHAHAVRSTCNFLKALRQSNILHRAAYVSVLSCPNTVVTGRLKEPIIPNRLDEDWRVSSSKRFPGKAVTIPECRVVPEIYTSDRRFIMPGVSCPEQLFKATKVINDIATIACDHTNGSHGGK